ncbi:MAG: Kdo hydroxylase family protein [Planctomycetota bacterium]
MRLFKHPELEDYFEEVEAGDLARVDSDRVVAAYESGKAIYLRDFRLDYDREFLSSVEFPTEPKTLKKLPSHAMLAELEDLGGLLRPALPDTGIAALVLREVFAGDKRRFRAFVEQVRAINGQLKTLCERLFPGYRPLHHSMTWRFSETLNENLHVDVYREDLPDHHLRLFVNLDDAPRIWNVSWNLDQMLGAHLQDLDPEFVRQATPGRICHDLNFAVFGRVSEAGRDGQPRHVVFFDPGDVWLVDSRKVSHQVLFGRRAVSTDFAIRVDSMADQRQHYYRVVEEHRQRPPRRANPREASAS